MIEYEINNLRRELNDLIERGASFQEIYIMSTTLDKLIVAYYMQTAVNK